MDEKFVPDSAPQPAAEHATRQEKDDSAAAMSFLLLSLQTLSKRTVIALSNLFTLLTAAAVFALAYLISVNPTTAQLVELGLFSAFVLLLHFVRGR